MKRIMVDMDDVMVYCNFLDLLENYLGQKIDLNDNKGYYLQDILGDKKDDFFFKNKNANFYEGVELLPDCYEVLKELNEKYEVYICTDYIWRDIPEVAGENLKNKYNFLYEKLDFMSPRNFIFIPEKSIVDCDIRIDDKVINLEGDCEKLLFSAWHNVDISDEELKSKNIVRVNNWKEIKEYLIKGE